MNKNFEIRLFLLEGKEVSIKANRYEDLMCEIDNFFDIFKDNVTYYSGYGDQDIINQAQDEGINLEVIE